MEMPLVSVIVPVYNAEKFIEKSILSILNQSYKNIELIIINDGSNDRSEEKIKKIIHGDSRVIYYKHNNSGPSTTRNVGIDMFKGHYLLFIDSDDTIEKEYIQSLVSPVLKNNFDIVSSGYTDFSIHGKVLLNDFYQGKTNLSKKQYINSLFNGVGGTLWGKIFKREIIIENKLKMNPQIFMCEDLLFVLEYTMHCKNFGVINENYYNYNRLNENSISSNANLDYYKNLILVLNKIEEILKSYNYDQTYIDHILSKRVQNLFMTCISTQNNRASKLSKKEKLQNLEAIIFNDYFKKYECIFTPTSLKERISIYLIRKNKKELLILYSFLFFFIRRTKDDLKLKIQKNRIMKYRILFEGGTFENY